MLNDSDLGFSNFLRFKSCKPIRIWLLNLLKDSLEEFRLLIFRLLNLNLFLRLLLHLLLFGLYDLSLVQLFSLLQHFATNLSHSMIIIGTIWTVLLQEGELCVVLLALKNHFLELRTVCGHMLGSLLDQFYLLKDTYS